MQQRILYTILFLILTYFAAISQSNLPEQTGKKIEIIHADFTDYNEYEIPGAMILTGNIYAQHDSIYLRCNKAYFFQAENYIKLFGNVDIVQNDTLRLTSKYAEYNGMQKIAYAQGNVVMTSPDSRLITEKIYYDRANGIAYYNDGATIQNKENTLKSKSGKYYTNDLKYEFRTSVVLTNPKTKIVTDHLDFYEVSGHAYLFGPSTITSDSNLIYTENGFYDTQLDQGKLLKNSHIIYDNRRIEAEELYYDKSKGYFKGTNHVKVTDTVNKIIATSHLAEVYRKPTYDSIYMTKRPLIKTVTEKDSAFFYAKNIIITGPDKERLISGYHNIRMFREPDMSGKADSLHYAQKIGLLELIGKPVLFKGESQLTGKYIHLIHDAITEKLDSLKVLENAFVIERDTLGAGYNQAKGLNMYGKFVDNKIKTIDLIQNAEMIYFIYDDLELMGIDKGICSAIRLELEDNKIQTATRFKNPSSITYPPEQLPEAGRVLPGFVWRGDERILTKEEVVPKEEEMTTDEIQDNQPIELDTNKEKPLPASNETLQYKRKGNPTNKIKNTI